MTRVASRREHQRFCEIEGWTEVRNARGKPTQHHVTYELPIEDGSILRTRISRPTNNDTYGNNLWSHILADQLHVTPDEFWNCVNNGSPPGRAPTAGNSTSAMLPASLANHLVHTLHLTSQEIADLSLEEAVRRMAEYWAQPPM